MAMPQDLVTFLEHGDVCLLFSIDETLVKLVGDVDLSLTESLDFVLEEATARTKPVRVDLSLVTFMDSTGLNLIAQLAATELQAGRRLSVRGATHRVRELLQIAGLMEALELTV